MPKIGHLTFRDIGRIIEQWLEIHDNGDQIRVWTQRMEFHEAGLYREPSIRMWFCEVGNAFSNLRNRPGGEKLYESVMKKWACERKRTRLRAAIGELLRDQMSRIPASSAHAEITHEVRMLQDDLRKFDTIRRGYLRKKTYQRGMYGLVDELERRGVQPLDI